MDFQDFVLYNFVLLQFIRINIIIFFRINTTLLTYYTSKILKHHPYTSKKSNSSIPLIYFLVI